MRTEFDAELEERLVRYAAIDTQSSEDSASAPSTACQFDLLNLLVDELRADPLDQVGLRGRKPQDEPVLLLERGAQVRQRTRPTHRGERHGKNCVCA